MQALSIFAKVLGTNHKTAHRFEHRQSFCRELVPSPLQSVYWGRAKGRDDGCEGRIVVEGAAFLPTIKLYISHMQGDQTYISHKHKVLDYYNSLLDVVLGQYHLRYPVSQLI